MAHSAGLSNRSSILSPSLCDLAFRRWYRWRDWACGVRRARVMESPSGILPGNSSGAAGAPGSRTGGGISGFGLPGGMPGGGSVGVPGVAGGISGGSIGISFTPFNSKVTTAPRRRSSRSAARWNYLTPVRDTPLRYCGHRDRERTRRNSRDGNARGKPM